MRKQDIDTNFCLMDENKSINTVGYTTGACAAAVCAAAAQALFSQKKLNEIEIDLPGNNAAIIDVNVKAISKDSSTCSVIKKSNESNDATNGIEIIATACYQSKIEIKILKGIGIATKKGLQVKVGEHAINPVPKEMISDELNKVLKTYKKDGIRIELSAPEGEKRAKKTLNEKLGIVGGISILGTTGLMRPMSSERWKMSLLPQLEIAVAAGHKDIFIVPGNMGENAAIKNFNIEPDRIVQANNFIGFMLKKSVQKGANSVIILGHVGKLSKLAYGYMNTHSGKIDKRFDLLKKILIDNNPKLAEQVAGMATFEEASILLKKKAPYVLEKIADMAEAFCQKQVNNYSSRIGIVFTNLKGEIMALGQGAKATLGSKCLL